MEMTDIKQECLWRANSEQLSGCLAWLHSGWGMLGICHGRKARLRIFLSWSQIWGCCTCYDSVVFCLGWWGFFCFFPLIPYVLTKIDAGALCKASCQRDSKDVWKKFEERWRNSTFENSGIYILWLYIVGYINSNVDVFGDGVDVQPTRSTRSSYKLTRKRESWPRFIPVANSAVTGVQSKNGWDLRRVSYFLIWTFFFIHLCYLFLQVYITSCLHCHVLCELSPCIIIFIFLKKAQKVGLIQDMDTFCPLLAYLVCNI